ncbi:hypothetical protein [Lutibacter sp.]|uniref:hypothetical protein n=1 Tax=Lutibacter sp. TaxID=1925666 RepID=UPI0034A05FFC
MDEYIEPISQVEIEGRLIEPAIQGNDINGINRNLQLGNLRERELSRLQSLEEFAMVLEKVPVCMGGNILAKWAEDARFKKHHFLVLSGSKNGFVRTMSRTSIQEASMNNNTGGIFKGLMRPKRRD